MEWILIILIRLIVPVTILKWPLIGSILAIIADNLDVVILDFLGVKDFSSYNSIDKLLDSYFYLIQGYTIIFWKNKLAKKIGLTFLVYRTIGMIIYEITQLRLLLFVFPNVFIFYYMYYLLYKKIRKKEPFSSFRQSLPILLVLLFAKLCHEYFLHVAQFPIYETLKNLFIF